VPDPRHARGQRYAWRTILVLLISGLASGCQTARAIAHWSRLHHATLQALLPDLLRVPSESTFLRTLRAIDVGALENALSQFTQTLVPQPAAVEPADSAHALYGQALDGKAVRGANAHGRRTHLVSLVRHGSGRTLAQVAVAQKRNEISASQTLLAPRDLTGTVTTMDALLAQRHLAQQICLQGGHYWMVVKENHALMREECAFFFDLPSIPADHDQRDRYQSVTKGHGRIEVRTLECLTGHCADWRWPGASQVLRRTCERLVVKTGKRTSEVTYGITSLRADEADAALLERLWRGHWTIENRKHDVRDVTMGEDRNQMHTGQAPHVLAACRNVLIDLWRSQGWTNIADAIRTCAASVWYTLTVVGGYPTQTLT
jgi:predicted transposase YbfD/YdcC